MRAAKVRTPKTKPTQALKSFPLPSGKPILLACGKCQRKLRKHDPNEASNLGKLRKLVKRRGAQVFVVNSGCLDVCPQAGVTVCTGDQAGRGEFSVLRSEADLDVLLSTFVSTGAS